MLSLFAVLYMTTGTFSFHLGEAFVYCILALTLTAFVFFLSSYFFLYVPFI
jgi:hypothetical protein